AHLAHDIDVGHRAAPVVAALDLDRLLPRPIDHGDDLGPALRRPAGADADAVAGLAELDLGRPAATARLGLDGGLQLRRAGARYMTAPVDHHLRRRDVSKLQRLTIGAL